MSEDKDDLIARLQAEVERLTPLAVAYDYLESPARADMAEAEVARLTAENEKMREALEWYADPSNYMARFDPHDDRRRYPPKTILDDGNRARASLSNTSEGGKGE